MYTSPADARGVGGRSDGVRISLAICMRRAMRSSVGGCVENKREKPTAENGLAIIIADTDWVPAVLRIGAVCAP